MAICPECRAVHGDDVPACPEHGCLLVPDDFFPKEDTLESGTMVGEYRIERKLGSGSFGDVYAGEHPLIGKKVAVKVLNRRFASDPEAISRFVAEARAVNKIRHRNIIDIFSFGVLREQQRHYFVMELLDGRTLRELLEEKKRLPLAAVVHIARGVAAALDAAHEVGITHRDLKPDNVFLAVERDGTCFPKLLDFGIAKLMNDEPVHRTGTGVVLGTPRYMSPEQARGKKIDHRSDIYALGVMLHEMLTGSAPFSGESVMDVLHAHVSEPPPRMSSVCPDLPRALDAPVLAMLEKRPKDRPPTAGQAVAALAEYMGAAPGKSLDAPPPIPRERQMAETLALVPTQQSPAPAPAAAGKSGPSTVSSSSIEPPSTNGPRGSALRRWALPLGLLGLAGGASIWSFARSPSNAPPEAPAAPSALASPAPAPRPSPSLEAPPGITPSSAVAPAGMIEVRLSTHPADVEVWLDDRKLGTSSAPIALPRGSERIELRMKKTGYQDESLALVPERDQSLGASLSPLPPRREGQPESAKAAGHQRMERILGDRD